MKQRVGVFLALVIAMVALSPQAANASPSTVSFVTAETTAAFGDPWVVEIEVGVPAGSGGAITAASGSVDVLVSGIAGTYATVPLQNGGAAFFAQPSEKPLLGAGTYTLTAIFNPSAGSNLSGSTSAPATLIITPLEVTTIVTATADPVVSSQPVITALLGGAYRDATGTVPAGIWSFEIAVAGDDRVVFETRRVQDPFAEEATSVVVDTRLSTSTEYTVRWTFEPVEQLAAGLAIETAGATSFRTPDGTLLTALANPVELPLWTWIAIAIVLVGLLATMVILLILTRSRAKTPAVDEEPESRERAEPDSGGENRPVDAESDGTLKDLGLDES